MSFFSILAVVVMLVLVGVGIVLGAEAVVLTFALVAAGVLGGVVVALMFDFVAGRVRRWLGAPLEGAKRRELPHV